MERIAIIVLCLAVLMAAVTVGYIIGFKRGNTHGYIRGHIETWDRAMVQYNEFVKRHQNDVWYTYEKED